METQTQTKPTKTTEEKIKELKRQNKKLMSELLEVKSKLDKYRQDNDILTRRVVMLENIILDLIGSHYGDRVKASFIDFELCIDQRCVKFGEYDELLIALRVLPLLI
jgi:chromosome segregation ATPase